MKGTKDSGWGRRLIKMLHITSVSSYRNLNHRHLLKIGVDVF